MKIAVIYIYPVAKHGAEHATLADRFVRTYRENPPMMDHQMVVVSNGGPPSGKAITQFSWIAGTKFLQHDDSGMDIGGYQLAARSVGCDLMVFFGGSSYFRGPGWLRRMVNVYEAYGDGLFGCTGNQGDNRVTANGSERIWPHVRTTGFWCNPKLVNTHPLRVKENHQRYPYEHGPNNITGWALLNNKPAMIATWKEVKPLMECDSLIGGFHQGQQENLIVGDKLTASPYWHTS